MRRHIWRKRVTVVPPGRLQLGPHGAGTGIDTPTVATGVTTAAARQEQPDRVEDPVTVASATSPRARRRRRGCGRARRGRRAARPSAPGRGAPTRRRRRRPGSSARHIPVRHTTSRPSRAAPPGERRLDDEQVAHPGLVLGVVADLALGVGDGRLDLLGDPGRLVAEQDQAASGEFVPDIFDVGSLSSMIFAVSLRMYGSGTRRVSPKRWLNRCARSRVISRCWRWSPRPGPCRRHT